MRVRLTRFHALVVFVAAVLTPIAVQPVATARADVLTNSNNLLRNGWYPDQTALSPATVSGGNFGRLFSAAVDGQVYAQPIVSQGTLLVATDNNNVYGLDPHTGDQHWQRTYGTPFNASDIACGDLAPHVGITGTPVVDPATNVAYFLDKEYTSGSTGPVSYIAHAVDVATGAEVAGWPVTIQGYADNATQTAAHHFDARTLLQRPGLLLMNGVVYAAFGSSCDVTPYTGWIVGLSTASHAITTMFTTIRDDNAGSGIWQAGSGLVSDGPGQILFTTGNGGWDLTAARPGNQPPNDLSEAVVRAVVQPNGTLKPVDFFAPYDGPALENNDLDFGSGGPVGLPESYNGTPLFGSTAHPHLLVAEGKQGYVYLLDRNNLGGYLQGSGGGDGVVDRIGPYGGVWSRPAVWPGDGGYVYMVTANGSGGQTAGSSGFLRAYKYNGTGSQQPTLSLAASSSDTFGFGSGAPVVTSNGIASGSALLWVVWEPDGSGANAQLRAYDPVPNASGHFDLKWSGPIGTASKFSMPVVDNSHVYVGTRDGHVLAFWSPVSSPLSASPPQIPATVIGTSSTAPLTFTAQQATTVTAFSSTNTAFTVGTPSRTLPATLAKNDTISVPITFTPTHAGLASATLRADTADGPVDIGASAVGEAASAQLVASPAQLSLGGTTAGGTALSGSITLTNAGATTLTIGTTDVPPPASQFSVTAIPPNGSTIAPGGSVVASVTFAPPVGTPSGPFGGTVTFHSDGGDQPVALTAVVAAPPNVSIAPMSFNLGNVPLGAVADVNFTLHNSGGLSASFVRSKPPAKNVGFVATTALPEGTTLNAQDSLTETVRFTATTLGTSTDAWSLNPADGRGVRTVTFTARVVPAETLAPPSSSAWMVNGAAKFAAAPNPTSIQLTPPDTTLNAVPVDGSAFLKTPVSSKYLHVDFDAWIGGGTGADGLALVLANPTTSPTAQGSPGGGLGFSGISGTAIALDTYKNAANPSSNFVGISPGSDPISADQLAWIATNSGIPALETINANPPTGYQRTHVDVQIANGLANVNIGDVHALVDVPVSVPAKVLLGFTGGSGGDTDEHTVTNVHIHLARADTVVTAKPASTVGIANATFTFASTTSGSTFRCALDGGVARTCTSPHAVTVAPGTHTMSIHAVDPFGFSDPTPAVVKWTYTPAATVVQHGYWMLGSNGAVYAFGDARAFGNAPDTTAAHLTPTNTARGYWIVNSAGRVYPFGDARAYGNAGPLAPGERVTSMSATLTGKGYWLFTNAGRVFAHGDAKFHGDLANVHLNGSVIDSVPTASGNGYYMIASDGGVFAFGDARFFGSLGAVHLNQPIIGLVPTATGKGYWLDASDGGVFAFGDARFRGSLGSAPLNRPIVGMVRFGNGYLLAASDGGVFDFSDSPFLGSLGDRVPASPIVGLAAFDR
jgi:hypothetical protein